MNSQFKMTNRKYINSGLTNAIKSLYLDWSSADVSFVFKSSAEQVPAHKNLLFATSDVFRVMLNGCWKEKNEIHICDASAAAFREFLQFFYVEEVELSMENIADVINLGKKYNVDGCMEACVRFLEYNMTPQTVCSAYELASLYEIEYLKNICDINFAIDASVVFESTAFLDCDIKVLRHILKMDTLLCSEAKIFQACLKWLKVTAKTNEITRDLVELHLGKLFDDIRFGSMQLNEFNAIKGIYRHLFTDEESKHISQMIIIHQRKSESFNRIQRGKCWRTAIHTTCHRLWSVACEFEHQIDQPIKTSFYSDSNLLLCGVLCAELFRFDGFLRPLTQDFNGELKINEIRGRPRHEEILSAVYFADNVKFIAGKDTFIVLKNPIIIRRGIKYEIQLDLNLPFVCCSLLKFKSTDMGIDHGISVKFSGDYIANNEKRGIIYGLQFIKDSEILENFSMPTTSALNKCKSTSNFAQ